jgi:hypothetical protein
MEGYKARKTVNERKNNIMQEKTKETESDESNERGYRSRKDKKEWKREK